MTSLLGIWKARSIIAEIEMSKVSIIIPSRNETYEIQPGVTVLQRMVQDIYEKATGDFEVLVGFDGPPYQDFPDFALAVKALQLRNLLP